MIFAVMEYDAVIKSSWDNRGVEMITVPMVLFTALFGLLIAGTMSTLILAAIADGKTQHLHEEIARR